MKSIIRPKSEIRVDYNIENSESTKKGGDCWDALGAYNSTCTTFPTCSTCSTSFILFHIPHFLCVPHYMFHHYKVNTVEQSRILGEKSHLRMHSAPLTRKKADRSSNRSRFSAIGLVIVINFSVL